MTKVKQDRKRVENDVVCRQGLPPGTRWYNTSAPQATVRCLSELNDNEFYTKSWKMHLLSTLFHSYSIHTQSDKFLSPNILYSQVFFFSPGNSKPGTYLTLSDYFVCDE